MTADKSNQNENGQHNGLCDCERRLILCRSQRIESCNLHEALHDQETVEIERHHSG